MPNSDLLAALVLVGVEVDEDSALVGADRLVDEAMSLEEENRSDEVEVEVEAAVEDEAWDVVVEL